MPDLIQDKFVSPTPANLAKTVVYEVAEKIAIKLGYEPGSDLEPIVRRLGGSIKHQPWDEATGGGSLEVYPSNKSFLIRISPLAGDLRNRFTIAHEIGHYFLHSEVGKKPIRVLREGTGRLEWEANWFAAGFLMPAAQFKKDWIKHRGSKTILMGIYQVSVPVIEIRAASLRLA